MSTSKWDYSHIGTVRRERNFIAIKLVSCCGYDNFYIC